MKTLFVFAMALFILACGPAWAVQSEIFGLQQDSTGNFHILRYDAGANSFYDCGQVGSGTPQGSLLTTNLAMDANRRLYYMHPFDPNLVIWQADLDSGNNLINQQVHDTLTPGLSIIDGFTIGPDQQLYMTGYGHSEIYRYVIGSNSGSGYNRSHAQRRRRRWGRERVSVRSGLRSDHGLPRRHRHRAGRSAPLAIPDSRQPGDQRRKRQLRVGVLWRKFLPVEQPDLRPGEPFQPLGALGSESRRRRL